MHRDFKKTLKIISLSAFFLFIIIYAFFRSEELIFGVKIKNITIENGATLSQNSLIVDGNAKNATNLFLNGREIFVDKNGNFNETLALLSGYNVINIKAKDKFGKVDEKNYKLMHIGT